MSIKTIYTCDRCKKAIECFSIIGKSIGSLSLTKPLSIWTNRYDLCDECVSELMEWLKDSSDKCPTCNGTGDLDYNDPKCTYHPCYKCNGTGIRKDID